MKLATIVLATAALIAGLLAAWKWYEASQVHPKPNWKFEPVVPTLRHMGWDTATLEAFQKAGELNARAALWTAASVALSALSTILGGLAA